MALFCIINSSTRDFVYCPSLFVSPNPWISCTRGFVPRTWLILCIDYSVYWFPHFIYIFEFPFRFPLHKLKTLWYFARVELMLWCLPIYSLRHLYFHSALKLVSVPHLYWSLFGILHCLDLLVQVYYFEICELEICLVFPIYNFWVYKYFWWRW